MISMEHIEKTFKVAQKEIGVLGSIKGLFSRKYRYVYALKDISFDIEEGEIVSILGSNGAGKSTCIKIMTGLLKTDKGKAVINSVDPFVDRTNYVKEIGVVFGQRTQLWWELNVEDSFNIIKEMYEVPDDVYEKNLTLLNELVNIKQFFDKPVRTLSLGQRMLCEISAAFVHNPKIVFLDEPTIGLDVSIKSKIHDLIRTMKEKKGTTIILTSHDITDITALSKRVIIIDKGKKIFDGEMEELAQAFGAVQVVNIRMNDSIQGENFYKELKNKYEGCYENISRSANEIQLEYDKKRINLSELIDFISRNKFMEDIELKGPDIEYVLKQVYSGVIS